MVQIRLEKQARIVRCTPHENVGIEDMSNASYLISQKYGHYSPIRIFVDVRRVQIHMAPEDNQKFVEFICSLPGFDEARIAVLHSLSHNSMQATNRESRDSGLLVRSFFSEAESIRWLTTRTEICTGMTSARADLSAR